MRHLCWIVLFAGCQSEWTTWSVSYTGERPSCGGDEVVGAFWTPPASIELRSIDEDSRTLVPVKDPEAPHELDAVIDVPCEGAPRFICGESTSDFGDEEQHLSREIEFLLEPVNDQLMGSYRAIEVCDGESCEIPRCVGELPVELTKM